MKTFHVTGIVDATVNATVQAETPEEAIEKAELCASVCHQCANELEVGDVIATRVYDEKHNEVYTDERDNGADVRALAAYLKGKRVPKHIRAIVERWS